MSLTHITFGPHYEQIPTDAHRVVVSGELPAASSATMQSLVIGSNLVSQPSTITVTGSVGLNPNPVLDSLTVSGTGMFYAPIYQGSVTGANRVMVSGELAASEGVTSLVAGSNITLVPSTITTTGTIGLDPNLSVSTGTFSSDVLISGQTVHFAPVYQGSTSNRYVTSGELPVSNPGTVTSLVAGSNIVFAPSPITGSGSIGLDPNPLVSSITVSGQGTFYGNVGIGTASPAYSLDVASFGTPQAMRLKNTTTYIQLGLSSNLGTGYITVEDNGAVDIVSGGTGGVVFRPSNTSRGSVTNEGYWRLNNTTGTASLNVNAVSATTIGTIIKSAFGQTADLMQWQISGTDQVAASIGPTGNLMVSGTAQFYNNISTYGTVIMKSGMGDPVAPGAAMGMLRWEPGTNAGTLKLVAYAGTLASGVLIVDNVGSGS